MGSDYSFDRKRRTAGILTTIVFHALLLFILWSLAIPPPPPPQEELIILFEPDKDEKELPVVKEQPRVKPSPEKENLAINTPVPARRQPAKPVAPQKAVNPVPATSPSGTTGDVEQDEPEPEPTKQEVNPRALFQSQPTVDPDKTPQSGASIKNEALFKGTDPSAEVSENASTGTDTGPSFSLTGRSVVGRMPLPEYSENIQGRVVVEITVDKDGKVTSARPRAQGSTVQNAKLWEAARQAALKTLFTPSSTEVVQYGTITYIFKLK